MDVLSVATTVCSLCNQIVQWIEALAEKETLLGQISSTVLQVYNILLPFSSSKFEETGEYQLSESIRAVGNVLRSIEEHLQAYNSKTTQKIFAFLNPSAVVQKLNEDQRQLNHQLVILLTSIAAVGYFRDREKDLVLANTKAAGSKVDVSKDGLDGRNWDDRMSASLEMMLDLSEEESGQSTFCSFDHSREAYFAKQAGIARWVERTNQHVSADPFIPLPGEHTSSETFSHPQPQQPTPQHPSPYPYHLDHEDDDGSTISSVNYSPDAIKCRLAKQAGIADWVERTNQHVLAAPFAPLHVESTLLETFYHPHPMPQNASHFPYQLQSEYPYY